MFRYIRDYNHDRMEELKACGWKPRQKKKKKKNKMKKNKKEKKDSKPLPPLKKKRTRPKKKEEKPQKKKKGPNSFKDVPAKYPGNEFTVIPIHSFKRKYIRVDRNVFYQLLTKQRCIHPCFRIGNRAKDYGELSEADWRKLWHSYFHIDKIERYPTRNRYTATTITFDDTLVTDGVGVSFNMRKTTAVKKKKSEKEIRKEQQQAISNAQQIYAFDIGLKYPYAGIRRSMSDGGSEVNVRKTHKEFHLETGTTLRTAKMKHFSRVIDEKMRLDRERTYKYALQSFLHYVEMNKGLDKMATDLINKQLTVVFVGDRFVFGNSIGI